MAEGIQITITNLSGSNVTITDVKDLTDFAGYATPGPVTIAPAGTVTIPYTSRVAVSLEEGVLFTLLGLGDVDVTFDIATRFVNALGVSTDTYVGTAGEDLLTGNLVSLDSSGDLFKASQTTSLNRYRVFGVVSAGALTGNPVTVYTGKGLYPVRFAIPLFGSSNGSTVFLGTNGVGALGPPSGSGTSVVEIGIMEGDAPLAVTPDVLFNPRHVVDIP